MAVKNTVHALNVAAVDAATFTGAFQPITLPAGLAHPCFWIRIINNSSKDIFISYDGHNVHDFLGSERDLMLMTQANSQPGSGIALMPKGQMIYILGDVGGTGDVYLTGYYQS
jgi:hypothetical protein